MLGSIQGFRDKIEEVERDIKKLEKALEKGNMRSVHAVNSKCRLELLRKRRIDLIERLAEEVRTQAMVIRSELPRSEKSPYSGR